MKPGDVVTPCEDVIIGTVILATRRNSPGHMWTRGALLTLISRGYCCLGFAGWNCIEPTGGLAFLFDDHAGLCEVVIDV